MSDEPGDTSSTSSTESLPRENLDEACRESRLNDISATNAVEKTYDQRSSHSDYEDTGKSKFDSREDMKGDALGNIEGDTYESPSANQDLQSLLGNDSEGLEDLRDLMPNTRPSSSSSGYFSPNPIGLDVVIVHGFFGSRRSPCENPGSGTSKWLHAWQDRDCKIMSFSYDTSVFLSGTRVRWFIRRLAIKLLDDLKRARQQSSQRTIMFVAHDLGGIIVKDALTLSGLKPALYADVFDFTRLLVFYGCPHRSLSDGEMEDRLNRFLYRPCDSDKPKLPSLGQSTKALARAVIDINQLYMDSKHNFRSYVFSVFTSEGSDLDQVFDHYTSTMGVPFELRYEGENGGGERGIENGIDEISSLIRVNVNLLANERMLLSAASPLLPLKSGPGGDHVFSWISDNSWYKSWYNQRKPQLLYLHSSLDTQLASEFIFYDLEYLHLKRNGQVVVYFSFDKHDIRRDNIQDMLATIQIQMLGHFPTISDISEGQLEQHQRDRSLHYKDLLHWFEHYRHAGEVDGISCVLNHFDECEPMSRKSFLDQLQYASQAQERPFRVLVTSRQPRVLLEELSEWPALDLDQLAPSQPTQISSIASYESLSYAYSNVRGFKKEVEEELKAISKLESDVQTLILQHVVQDERWPSTISIRHVFGSLEAVTIESAVSKILDQIPDKPFVLRSLTLLLYAVRPPTVWELAAINRLATTENSSTLCSSVAETDKVRNKLQMWLAGIVILSQAEAFITTPRIREALLAELNNATGLSSLAGCLSPNVAHANIAKCCLQCLSSETAQIELQNLYDVSRTDHSQLAMICDRTSLLDYATQFWVHHLALSSDSEGSFHELATDLTSFHDSGAVSSWTKALWVLANPMTRSRQPTESLYPILAGAGLASLAEEWTQAEDLSIGLVEASSNRSIHTAYLLLSRLRHSAEYLQDALVGAGAYGDEAAWFDLIAHIHAEYPDFPWTTQVALVCRASWLDQEKVLNKLLDLGCPVDESIPNALGSRTPLRQAVYMNSVTSAKILIKRGADPLQVRSDGRTLLYTASSMGYVEMVNLLAEHGADLNAASEESITPIYAACLYGHYKVVEALAALGADPNIKVYESQDEPAWAPITCALSEKHTNCAHALLNAGVDLVSPGVHGVPLWYAVNLGLLGTCRDILNRGSDPNNHPGSPPMLIQAVTSKEPDNRLEIIELLINKETRINDKDTFDQTALWWACQSDHPQTLAIVALLLKHGANVNSQSQDGNAPLHIAVSRGNVELLELLVKTPGVNLDVVNMNDARPISLAYDNEALVRVLLEAEGDPKVQQKSRNYALVAAIRENLVEVVKLFIQHNTRIDPPDEDRDNSRWEPMELAAHCGRSDIVRILAESGSDINRRFVNNKPLVHIAVDDDALGALLEFRPRLDVQDDSGGSPLHAIRRYTSLENVKLLVRAGLDINLTNKDNVTPLVQALRWGNEEAANYLLSKKASLVITSPVYGGALHAACSTGLVDVVRRLIELGADVNMVVSSLGGSPLSCLFNGYYYNEELSGEPKSLPSSEAQTEILDMLIAAGADVTMPSGLFFGTVSGAVAWGGIEEHIEKIASKGAIFSAKDAMGRQPLHIAAVRGNVSIFTAILDASPELGERDNCGRNIVSWAAQGGCVEILEKTLDIAGAEAVNEQDMTGWTPLCWAARGVGTTRTPLDDYSQRRMILTLLERGADKSIKSSIEDKEYTPEGIATSHGCSEDIIGLLSLSTTSSVPPSNTNRMSDSGEVDGMPPRGTKLRNNEGSCGFCFAGCWGFKYVCKTCVVFCLCYKCYELKHHIHPSSHDFEVIGQEYESPSESPPSRRSSQANSTSGASTSSESDSESESEDDG
ncbi:ankyrin [Xylaria bambusicola]|uniref:ankyrin n=1 Tax=Xylaria bambusicola TaxID=326684 RepID=UPI002008A34F|nr:ankyrin [Xylaria bambusicola]KAI0516990.1 ankyrin [Xylaria bambusicola]